MAVTSVTEQFEGRMFTSDTNGYRGVRTFIVEVDDPNDDGEAILTASDPDTSIRIPARGQAWPGTSPGIHPGPLMGAIHMAADSIVATPRAGMVLWDVTASYKSGFDYTTLAIVEPLAKPTVWSIVGSQFTEEIAFDVRGRATVNTAGVPIDPPIMGTGHDTLIRMSWNVARYPLQLVAGFRGTVNEFDFSAAVPLRGHFIPALQGRMVTLDVEHHTDSKASYDHVTAEILWRHTPVVSVPGETISTSPHDVVRDSYGYQQRFDSKLADVRVRRTKVDSETGVIDWWDEEDSEGNDVAVYVAATEAQPLDQAGKQITDVENVDPARKLFQLAPRVDWSGAGLPIR